MDPKFIVAAVLGVLLCLCVPFCSESVEPGHEAVGVLFSKVQDETLDEGWHWPVNPLTNWDHYSKQEQTNEYQKIGVPARDRLVTKMDISVFWKMDTARARHVRQNVGTWDRMEADKVNPAIRSALRDAGKTVEKSEEFYDDASLAAWNAEAIRLANATLEPWGVTIEQILTRDITLPPTIQDAVDATKKAEQEVAQAQAEARKYEADQQKRVYEATATAQAAEQDKIARQTRADAAAYEVTKAAEAQATAIAQVGEAISANPGYLQDKALDTLTNMSGNPAAQIFWLDKDAANPLPLMHLGATPASAGGN